MFTHQGGWLQTYTPGLPLGRLTVCPLVLLDECLLHHLPTGKVESRPPDSSVADFTFHGLRTLMPSVLRSFSDAVSSNPIANAPIALRDRFYYYIRCSS